MNLPCLSDLQMMEKAGLIASLSALEEELREAIFRFNEWYKNLKNNTTSNTPSTEDEQLNTINLLRDLFNERLFQTKNWLLKTSNNLKFIYEDDVERSGNIATTYAFMEWLEHFELLAGSLKPYKFNGYYEIVKGDYRPDKLKGLITAAELIQTISDRPPINNGLELEPTDNNKVKLDNPVSPSTVGDLTDMYYDEDDDCWMMSGRFPCYVFQKGYRQGRLLEVVNNQTGEVVRVPHPKDALYREIKIER